MVCVLNKMWCIVKSRGIYTKFGPLVIFIWESNNNLDVTPSGVFFYTCSHRIEKLKHEIIKKGSVITH